jgi:lipoprotein Spr
MKILKHISAFILLFSLGLLTLSCSSVRQPSVQLNLKRTEKIQLQKKYENVLGYRPNKKQLALIKEIDVWMGVPYKYGGISKKGVDCSGFTFQLYQSVYDLKIPRSTTELHKETKKIKPRKAQFSDLVFFQISKKNSATHVGIYLGNNKFAHASSSRGVVIDDLKKEYYQKHFLSFGRP